MLRNSSQQVHSVMMINARDEREDASRHLRRRARPDSGIPFREAAANPKLGGIRRSDMGVLGPQSLRGSSRFSTRGGVGEIRGQAAVLLPSQIQKEKARGRRRCFGWRGRVASPRFPFSHRLCLRCSLHQCSRFSLSPSLTDPSHLLSWRGREGEHSHAPLRSREKGASLNRGEVKARARVGTSMVADHFFLSAVIRPASVWCSIFVRA